jgi:hypothetical protein
MNTYQSTYNDGGESNFSIKLLVPNAWVPELNKLSHAAETSRLRYIRSRLRKGMDEDLSLLKEQIETHEMFRDAQDAQRAESGWCTREKVRSENRQK